MTTKQREGLVTLVLLFMFISGLVLYVNAASPLRYVGIGLVTAAFSAVTGLACRGVSGR